MERKTRWGIVIVGAVAALTLGAIGVASAASTTTATPTPQASTGAGASGWQKGDGAGPRGGMLKDGGPGDIAEALAALSGKDQATIMQQRAAGTSFAAIAKSYGVTEAQLIAKATEIEKAELDAAVKAGQITDAQRTEYLSGLQARLQAAVTSTDAMPVGGPGGQGGGHHGGMGGGGDIAEALAALSGKDQATIMQQRAAGTSFAAIAKSYGVTEAQLIAKATEIEKAELDAAVKAGQLTDAQRTEILSGLQARLQQEIAETSTMGPHGDGDGPQGAMGTDGSSGATGSGTTGSTGAQTSYQTY